MSEDDWGNWKSRERETRRERETGNGNGNGNRNGNGKQERGTSLAWPRRDFRFWTRFLRKYVYFRVIRLDLTPVPLQIWKSWAGLGTYISSASVPFWNGAGNVSTNHIAFSMSCDRFGCFRGNINKKHGPFFPNSISWPCLTRWLEETADR